MERPTDLYKLLGSLTKMLQQELDRYLIKLEINSSNYYFLVKLKTYGQLTQEQLVNLTDLNASNVTRALRKLEQRGIVQRLDNPKDKRSNLWKLTERGTELACEINQILVKVEKNFMASLSTADRQAFVELSQVLYQRSV